MANGPGRQRPLRARRRRAVSTQAATGFYSPVTTEGSIIVNSVAASVYTNYDHHVAHGWLYAPLRAWRSVFPDAAAGTVPVPHTKAAWASAVDSVLRDTAAGRALAQGAK